VLKHSRSG